MNQLVDESIKSKDLINYTLVTGAAGFIGSRLCQCLVNNRIHVLAVDRVKLSEPELEDKEVVYVKCDLNDSNAVNILFSKYRINQIIHLATELNFAVKSQQELFSNNVRMTENLLHAAKLHNIDRFIFTSSFAIYSGIRGGGLISEDINPYSVDEYGSSKIACEELIKKTSKDFPSIIIRCPLVVGSGRVGMLSVLFDLVSSGSPVITLNGGNIKHHCVAIEDVLDILLKSTTFSRNLIVNVGCDDVKTFRELYADLIIHAGSKSKIINFSSFWTVPIMRFLFLLKLSPLGPHQFRMLTEDCLLNINLIKIEMDWFPKVGHMQMMRAAYDEYLLTRNSLTISSANSKPVSSKALRLLKFLKIF
jgi:nucleoside-diphosphate-sugar epimerase